MTRFLVLGAGGHSSVIIDIINLLYTDPCISCLSDQVPPNLSPGCTFLGSLSLAYTESSLNSFDHAFVAIGDSSLRLHHVSMLGAFGYSLPSLIHPSAVISPTAIIGSATVVCANAVVQPFVRVGSSVILNTSCSVDHHSTVLDGVHVAPGAHIAGNVTLGHSAFVGIGASVIQGTSIGANSVIGSGAAVLHDVPPDTVVVGVPARPL